MLCLVGFFNGEVVAGTDVLRGFYGSEIVILEIRRSSVIRRGARRVTNVRGGVKVVHGKESRVLASFRVTVKHSDEGERVSGRFITIRVCPAIRGTY